MLGVPLSGVLPQYLIPFWSMRLYIVPISGTFRTGWVTIKGVFIFEKRILVRHHHLYCHAIIQYCWGTHFHADRVLYWNAGR